MSAGERGDLELRGLKHADRVEQLVRGPHAMLVPTSVREALLEQARLTAAIAAELERMRAAAAR